MLARNRTILLALVALLLAIAGYGLNSMFSSGTTAVSSHPLKPDDVAVTAQGAGVYATYCANCHGAQLQGEPNWRDRNPEGLLPAPPHDASGHTWHHPDDLLFRMTRDGIGRTIGQPDYRTSMPAYGGTLSDAEILAVLSWIKSQWPADVRHKHDEINRRYAAQRG